MPTIDFSPTDLALFIIATAGTLAGLLAYLMVPSFKRENEHCIKSILFGIIFALVSCIATHLLLSDTANGLHWELKGLFLWGATFVPALGMSLAYGIFSRKQAKLEF